MRDPRSRFAKSRTALAALAIVALAASSGCAEQRAERRYRALIESADARSVEAQREALAEIVARWPKTEAAAKAEREIEWINDLAVVSERGPALMAWDAVRDVSRAAEQFRLDRGRFPESLDEMVPSYLPAVRRDPWGHAVRYQRHGDGYRVICFGKDGIPGGTGHASDVLVDTGREVTVNPGVARR